MQNPWSGVSKRMNAIAGMNTDRKNMKTEVCGTLKRDVGDACVPMVMTMMTMNVMAMLKMLIMIMMTDDDDDDEGDADG